MRKVDRVVKFPLSLDVSIPPKPLFVRSLSVVCVRVSMDACLQKVLGSVGIPAVPAEGVDFSWYPCAFESPARLLTPAPPLLLRRHDTCHATA